MDLSEDRWLSAVVGHSVFKVNFDDADAIREEESAPWRDRIAQHLKRHAVGSYYAKIGSTRIDLVRHLVALGFYVVDMQVTFGLDKAVEPRSIAPEARSSCRIGVFHPTQREAVLGIAKSCFRYSRFHLDPLIPLETANQIKHDWILNYILKQRGEHLWVATVAERPAGFLAVIAGEEAGRRYRAIDLIGVTTEYQGRGIGQALVAFFVDFYRDQSDFLQVGTQIANLPSMRLYPKFGFSLIKSAYVMHRHVPQPGNR
ncbi:MAG: GNAT family N-acetyltransferase [Desulfobaccales bacterium]